MLNNILVINFTWRDALDIMLITMLFYKVIQMLKGTRALAAMAGLGLLMILYFAARTLGLYSSSWLLQHVFGSLFLVVIILFQKDIRQGLGEMGARYFWRRSSLRQDIVEELVSACIEMARMDIGALIIIERSMPLGDMITQEGVRTDAKFSRKLLMNIFYPKAPLHDGAVIISKGRITAAACILPLAVVTGQNFGTRHRAALGITEESDALAIVISEERGEISVALNHQWYSKLDATKLKQVINDAL